MALKIKTQKDKEKIRNCLETKMGLELKEIKVHITNRCNLKCSMCGNWKDACKKMDMSESTLRKAIDEGILLGLKNIKFFGGEPFMHNLFAEFVNYAKKAGLHTNVFTNGTFLTEETVQSMFENGLDEIIISLDGPTSGIQDKMRGVAGTFEKIRIGLSNIAKYLQKNPRDFKITVNVAVTNTNYDRLPELFNFCVTNAVARIVLNPVVLTHRSPNYIAICSEFDNLKLNLQQIKKYNNEIAPKLLAVADRFELDVPEGVFIFGESEEELKLAEEMNYTEKFHTNTCFRPFYYTIIRENGDILACNRVKDERFRPLGNINSQNLADVWNSEKYKTFREMVSPQKFGDCKRCCYVIGLLNSKLIKETNAT